jgi:hypothetical protein
MAWRPSAAAQNSLAWNHYFFDRVGLLMGIAHRERARIDVPSDVINVS